MSLLTGQLVNGTPRYPVKKAFCPDNECPVNEDWSPVIRTNHWFVLLTCVRLTGVRLTGTKFCPDNKRPVNECPDNGDIV